MRLLNSPNRDLVFETLGLGVLEILLDVGGCGRKSGMMPNPDGVGVASRGDGMTGLGDGLFRDGKRLPGCGR